ncbi:MAG: adenylate/guanylate cyclase domain-containing protein, partial [Steroidobacteraceae bacterium]
VETEAAVLFADIVGSTRLYELLGDTRARELILLCMEIMREATQHHRGTVIKTIGDEILATFPTADDAVDAAREMHEGIAARQELLVQGQHVSLRIGCHFGQVAFENDDIFGAAVHAASRVTSQAKSGQILLSAEAILRCTPEWRSVSRMVDVTPLRGLAEEIELHEVLWQEEDATNMLPSIDVSSTRPRHARVRVHYRGADILLDDAKKEITMGRADENDVVQKGTLISRLHARIEVLRDRFLLVDQSTNGTFVTNEDGKETFVRRDSFILQERGCIGLGRAPDQDAADVIRYVLED